MRLPVLNFIVLAFFIFKAFSLFGQSDGGQVFIPPSEPPPSPEASKIAQLVLNQPNLYTGSINSEIVLADIPFDGVNVPIRINNHSGGIRANEEAGMVGLGWSFSYGGNISRSINGLNDLATFQPYGFNGICFDPTPVPEISVLEPATDDWTYLLNNVDTEHDLFTYSFLNSSGKFILSKKSQTNDLIQVIKLEENADSLYYSEEDQTFTVLNPEGFKGVFSIREYVTVISGTTAHGDNNACTGNDVDIAEIFNQGGRAATGWYLSEIVSPKGRKLNFEYKLNEGGIFSDYYSVTEKSWSDYYMRDPGNLWSVDLDGAISCSRTITENIYLEKIYSDDLDIEMLFHYEEREDLGTITDIYGDNGINISHNIINQRKWINQNEVFEEKRPLSLDYIVYQNHNNNSSFSRNIVLHQSYFNDNQLQKFDFWRLRLDSLKVSEDTYNFSYLSINHRKSTKGVDYWGFYNGRNDNKRLLPAVLNNSYLQLDSDPNFVHSFDFSQVESRKANFNHGKGGLLTEIKYPTGGVQKYEFEPHQYKIIGKETPSEERTKLRSYPSSALSEDQINLIEYVGHFRGGCDGRMRVYGRVSCKDFFQGNDCTDFAEQAHKRAFEIVEVYTGRVIYKLDFNYLYAEEAEGKHYAEIWELERIPKGVYEVRSYAIRDENNSVIAYGHGSVFISNNCDETVPEFSEETHPELFDEYAGGARIKTIQLLNSNGQVEQEKKYTYKNLEDVSKLSSGILMNPVFHILFWEDTENGGIAISDSRVDFQGIEVGPQINFMAFSGGKITNGNAAQGSHIGYTYVQEHVIDKKNSKRSEIQYEFHNSPNSLFTQGVPGQYYPIGDNKYAIINGQMIQKFSYGKNLKAPQSLSQHKYVMEHKDSVNNLKMVKIPGSAAPGFFTFYNLRSDQFRMVAEEQFEFINAGNGVDTLYTKHQYEHNSKNQVISKSLIDNREKVLKSYHYKYPSDFDNSNDTIRMMKERNMISTPLTTWKVIDNKLSEKSTHTFLVKDDLILLRKKLRSSPEILDFNSIDQKDFLDVEGDIEYWITQYDEVGNPLEFYTSDGLVHSIIYGYNQNYPIVRLTGVSRAAIDNFFNSNGYHAGEGFIPQSDWASFQNHFSKANYKAFKYDPGIGVIEEIDNNGISSYYEYDGMGRLFLVKDHDQNIIWQKEYKFVNNQ